MSPDATNKSQANNTAVNLLQIIISQAPNIKHHFALHAKSFFIRGDSDRKLAPGLQIWHGFFQSVRPVLNSIMININTTATAIYTPGPLLEGAMSLLGCRDSRELVQRCKDERAGAQAMRKLKSFYKGVIVTVGPNKSKRKIEDIVPRAGFVEFEKSGQMSTVQEHFREHHHIALRFPEAFGVRVGKSAIFPAEVCDVFPGQIYRKQLDGPATTDMLRETAVRPDQRLDNIRKAISRDVSALDYGSSPFMRDAGMRVDTNPLETRGRRLQPPGVMYGNGTLHVRDGAWNVVNKTFQLPAKIIAWAVVSFDANPNAQRSAVHLAQTLCVNMKKLARGAPYQSGQPSKSARGAAMDTVKGFNDPQIKPGFVLVILPANAAPLRKEVKQWGDMLVGIPTQCVRAGKYEQANDQYCNNLALKINTKTGGINSILHSPISDFLKDCMIVVPPGCDVAHPSPGVTSRPSIASLVASEDEFATRYSTEVQVQPPRQESIDGIGGMIERAIKRYSEKQRRFPGRIVIYRDGVSEGEYAQVETNEIQAIKGAILHAVHFRRHTRHKAELIFIVVGKRHHVRFFPKDRSDADRTGNCFPGLVVDREIVHSTYMDFYLQSQGGLKGTSRPSHYIVLKNDANRSADLLQELSFALCHVYAAATRSVSIPAPVYCEWRFLSGAPRSLLPQRLCTRAVFQFRPELDYADESSTETSEFSLEKWQQGLGQSILKQQMYFI
ncbi:uncharacterized protein PHACADRAFT_121053 [Phanerochaete carnosa HHB-10118-sp]|uniref:Piwi domain-containing protein n=1 Tax=Phanerochaete carnosa (strain HHB-10118-sp) TaxID=650164 RepID=K5W971_PHACS|nr:uncharacterized protein PHACADRAFT_121053 [Phanerochaete carnosa HHB-10118-sp]EKM55524.1 hypothetical protein PHACADRAFT_121053 [Phanerochaete carnosa HHB-10118-sp]